MKMHIFCGQPGKQNILKSFKNIQWHSEHHHKSPSLIEELLKIEETKILVYV